MELRVPRVTSYARAPSSLFFLRSARYPQMPRFLQFLREFWPMPLPLMIHSALVLFAQRTRIATSARSIGFCVIWVCISSSSSSFTNDEVSRFLSWSYLQSSQFCQYSILKSRKNRSTKFDVYRVGSKSAYQRILSVLCSAGFLTGCRCRDTLRVLLTRRRSR